MTAAVSCQPMMTPAVPMDIPATSSSSALARKRRREIILSQRAAGGTEDITTAPLPVADPRSNSTSSGGATVENNIHGDVLPPKKRKISASDPIKKECTGGTAVISSPPPVVSPLGIKKEPQEPLSSTLTSSAPAKPVTTSTVNKHQRKYEPDVPMSKEEASTWRREQRRKRNRESAAASRQRQRDRITELEAEVEEWKAKFNSVMEKLRSLEEAQGTAATPALPPSVPELILSDVVVASTPPPPQAVISPCSSPEITSQPSPALISVATSSLVEMSRDRGVPCHAPQLMPRQEPESNKESMHHLNETISRQAVKITGDATTPSTTLSDAAATLAPDMPTPDPCISSETTAATTKITEPTKVINEMIPAPVSPSSVDQSCSASSSDSSSSLFVEEIDQENELGAFLLDAAEWL